MQQGTHYKDCLTNEILLKQFTSQFDLVRNAINRAKHAVQSGKETSYGRNMAAEILNDIAEGKADRESEEEQSEE